MVQFYSFNFFPRSYSYRIRIVAVALALALALAPALALTFGWQTAMRSVQWTISKRYESIQRYPNQRAVHEKVVPQLKGQKADSEYAQETELAEVVENAGKKYYQQDRKFGYQSQVFRVEYGRKQCDIRCYQKYPRKNEGRREIPHVLA